MDTPESGNKETPKNLGDTLKHQQKIDEDIAKLESGKEQKAQRDINERIEETFEDLEGKIFEKGDKIDLIYMGEDGKKENMSIDIDQETILYKDQEYKITLPKGAYISRVEFKEKVVEITGKVAFFDGTGETSYEGLIHALDNTINKGLSSIPSENGEIIIAKK